MPIPTQTVIFSGMQSTGSVLNYGISWGDIVGPVLFLLYTADVTNIAHRHGLSAHSYVDDLF